MVGAKRSGRRQAARAWYRRSGPQFTDDNGAVSDFRAGAGRILRSPPTFRGAAGNPAVASVDGYAITFFPEHDEPRRRERLTVGCRSIRSSRWTSGSIPHAARHASAARSRQCRSTAGKAARCSRARDQTRATMTRSGRHDSPRRSHSRSPGSRPAITCFMATCRGVQSRGRRWFAMLRVRVSGQT